MNAWLRLTVWALALLVVVLPLIAVVNGWIATERWPLSRLQVTGELDHVSAQAVRAAIAPELGKGFFAIDLRRIRDRASALPWVASVQVRKRWPDLLQVDIREHRPYAHWGENRWLSRDGVIFDAPQDPALEQLPHLVGPVRRVADVVALYRFAGTRFSAMDRTVAELRLSPRGSWSLILDDGTRIMIGHDDTEARLNRLLRALPQIIASNAAPIARADLRYTNGFALAFADVAPGGTTALPARNIR